MEGVDEMVGGFVVLEWYSLFGTSVLLESQTRKRTRGGGVQTKSQVGWLMNSSIQNELYRSNQKIKHNHIARRHVSFNVDCFISLLPRPPNTTLISSLSNPMYISTPPSGSPPNLAPLQLSHCAPDQKPADRAH